MSFKHASLFSGIGGFDYAAEQLGWENLFNCEWEEFPRRILNYYWPEAISYEDIKQTDFTIHRGTIDVLTGGFPCQPFSTAGKRGGTDDGRYLWGEYLRAIREIQPAVVVGENVTGLLTMGQREVFARVDSRNVVRYTDCDDYEAIYTQQVELLPPNIIQDLEKEGYKVQVFAIPAAGVGAPHRRERIWIVAHNINRIKSKHGLRSGRKVSKDGVETARVVTDASSIRNTPPGTSEKIKSNRSTNNGKQKFRGESPEWSNGFPGLEWDATNSYKKGLEGNGNNTPIGGKNKGILVGSAWQRFPTQSPICGGNDGLPTELDGITFSKWRNESIKGFGNAIVLQVFMQLGKAIQHTLLK